MGRKTRAKPFRFELRAASSGGDAERDHRPQELHRRAAHSGSGAGVHVPWPYNSWDQAHAHRPGPARHSAHSARVTRAGGHTRRRYSTSTFGRRHTSQTIQNTVETTPHAPAPFSRRHAAAASIFANIFTRINGQHHCMCSMCTTQITRGTAAAQRMAARNAHATVATLAFASSGRPLSPHKENTRHGRRARGHVTGHRHADTGTHRHATPAKLLLLAR